MSDDLVPDPDLNDRELYERIAMNLTELRGARRMSPEQLAARAGVRLELVEALERARGSHVRVDALTLIAAALKADISELLKPRPRIRH